MPAGCASPHTVRGSVSDQRVLTDGDSHGTELHGMSPTQTYHGWNMRTAREPCVIKTIGTNACPYPAIYYGICTEVIPVAQQHDQDGSARTRHPLLTLQTDPRPATASVRL